ncbi:hypothetical protein PN36_07965 [Candidatus Thiomargarita nelsonii]|uniref:Uncharacterized protein n=1 Tax=Candidatus Thiomargarita nelsonii TaxID=1003181 RepID=A0A0A6P5H6_9GAMM|nr:hypothetical protein PN36_07965 [Candidatus Thiomargarita nelsonii]
MQHLQAAFEQWYGDCQRTLTEISYDQVNERTLCVSEEKYIDFDWVAQKYFSGKNKPSTVDMLAFGSEHVLFVEFKAGKNVKVEKQKLQFKLLASLLLYERVVADIVNIDAKKLVSTKFVYLLVFDPINCPSSSARSAAIQNHLSKVQVRFGIDKYKGIFLEEALTPECGEEFKRVLQRFGVDDIRQECA